MMIQETMIMQKKLFFPEIPEIFHEAFSYLD